MRRSSRRLLACLCACVTFLLVGVPTASAALAKVDLLDFDRQTGGYGVQVAAAVTCNPPELPNTMTYLSVTLVQGTSPHRSYIEGFGGIVEPNLPPIVCDGTTHEYSFTVVRLDRYADRKFRPGPATAIYTVTQCTEVTPGNNQCTPTADETRERVKITP